MSPQAASIVFCVIAGLLAGGCEHTGDLRKGWFAAGEVGRFKKDPLLLPIVSSLDTGIEEPNDEFSQATDVRQEDLMPQATDYIIGRNDLITISITDLVGPGVETVKQTRVSESGNISLPLIGQVKAEGLTEAQLETEIARTYKEQGLMQNAQVSVTVAEARARTFSVLGSVARPGQYQIIQADFRVLDALVVAGDINSQGIDNLYVFRREDLAQRAMMPGTMPMPTTMPAPGTTTTPAHPAPGRDILAPRSQANPLGGELKPVAMLLQDAPATVPPPATGAAAANAPASVTTPPATVPATPGAPGGEGRYIIIDGKPVLVGNQGATTAGTTGTTPTTPATPTTPMPEMPAPMTPGAAAPSTTGGTFEFNNPEPDKNMRIIRVPIKQIKNGDLRYNIVVRPQDMIYVPQPTTGEYYIDGHINRTGVYSLTARKINLKQAIAAAGGFDQLAVPAQTEIIRRVGADKEVFARVNLDKVFSGDQPDIFLKPDDVVRVGTDALQPFIAAMRNAYRFTYGFGFLYDRNYAPQQQIR